MYSASTVASVLELTGQGFTDREIGDRFGISRSTVHAWRHGRVPKRERGTCDICANRQPAFPESDYAYLLGLYLGDGCISPHPRTFRMRICLDTAYPKIVETCAASLRAVCPTKEPRVGSGGRGCAEVSMYWNHWPCLFPQHGPGRKHDRPIILAPWQRAIVGRNRQPLLRGLIHSDGCRIVANDRGVMSIRYHFSNRSEDIKRIYCDSLDALNIPWTRPCNQQIAIYRKSAVARMDEFVGAKH